MKVDLVFKRWEDTDRTGMESRELHLVVTYHWWDKIVLGDKNEEYREGTHYWLNRLCDFDRDFANRKFSARWKNFTHLVLHRGYSSTVARFPIEKISIGQGNPQWGAPDNRKVIIIKIVKI